MPEGEKLWGASSKGWAESAPLGWNRVKVSEKLGATSVAPVAPADTSLQSVLIRNAAKSY